MKSFKQFKEEMIKDLSNVNAWATIIGIGILATFITLLILAIMITLYKTGALLFILAGLSVSIIVGLIIKAATIYFDREL